MTNNTLVRIGTVMHGAFIERENVNRPNYLILFNQNENTSISNAAYSLTGQGLTQHVITGLEPYTTYDIEIISGSESNKISKVTEPNIQQWDYKGVDTNTINGVLYFESTLNGNHTFKVSKSGFQDTTAPSKPTGFKVKP